MSAALYPTRLYWVGMRGCARWEGREQRLSAPPQLPGFPGVQVQNIDYAPGVVAMVMERTGPWRDMTTAEMVAARDLLRQLCPVQTPAD